MCTLCQLTQTFDPARHRPEATPAEAFGPETPAPTFPTAPEGTLEMLASYLTEGYWQDRAGHGEVRFDTRLSTVITVDLDGLTAAGQQLARWALEAWELVADLQFQEVERGADIRFQDHEPGAFASFERSGSTLWSAVVNVSAEWLDLYGGNGDGGSGGAGKIGGYGMFTYIHEVGHALGLGHLGNYNGAASYGPDARFANDSHQLSVMSYFSQDENSTIDASPALPVSAMMADIAAIQSLYGAPRVGSASSGDTTWGAESTLGGYQDRLFADLAGHGEGLLANADLALTIYDRDGHDLLDLSFSGQGARLDLTPGALSDWGGLTGNLALMEGTVIEDLRSGAGADHLTGNAVANHIESGAGDDTVAGGDGADTLIGGLGRDVLMGGQGDDWLRGGGAGASDLSDLGDQLFGGAGQDHLQGGAGNDALRGDAGADTLEGGTGSDTLIGGSDADLLAGAALSDLLFGGAGADFLNGGFGHDRLHGGGDADRFFHLGVYDHGTDWIQDYNAAAGDVLVFGRRAADVGDFQINFASTEQAGSDALAEAFVIHRPSGQILWALVDGAGQDALVLRLGGIDYDLMA